MSTGQFAPEGIGKLVQQRRTDDATRAPNLGDPRHVERPVKLLRRRRQDAKALRVADDPPRQKRHFQIRLFGQRRVLHAFGQQRLGHFAHRLLARPTARADGGFDGIGRLPHLERFDQGPAPGALLPGLIADHIDHRRAGLGIDRQKRRGRDFDQIGVQRPLAPVGKEIANFHRALPARIAQQAVDFGDHLHVGIFDAVMHRFDKMPRSVGAEMRHARRALELRGNLLGHRFELGPRMRAAADHHRRAIARPGLATRHAHADEMQPRAFEFGTAAAGVVEIGVAAVDQSVALIQQRFDRLDHRIDRRAGGDHEKNAARAGDGGNEILKPLRPDQALGQRSGLVKERRDPIGLSVTDRHGKSIVGQVQRQCRAHGPQTVYPDIGACALCRAPVRLRASCHNDHASFLACHTAKPTYPAGRSLICVREDYIMCG